MPRTIYRSSSMRTNAHCLKLTKDEFFRVSANSITPCNNCGRNLFGLRGLHVYSCWYDIDVAVHEAGQNVGIESDSLQKTRTARRHCRPAVSAVECDDGRIAL